VTCTQQAAEAIAAGVTLTHPDRVLWPERDRFTTNMAKSKRAGQVFIDYLRNSRGATAIASYSTRAREGAPVAVPLSWNELRTTMPPDGYDLVSVQRRLPKLRADPWRGFDEARRPLPRN
jgi:bifunctional non-homologous end joining protein LigD